MTYLARNREVGSGPVRIGDHLKFTEDIYSMFFVSNVKAEFIEYWKYAKPLQDQDGKIPDEIYGDEKDKIREIIRLKSR